MAKRAKKKRTGTFTMKAARPVRAGKPVAKVKNRGPQEVLNGRDWTAAAIAWNKDGNIVILDPRLAQFIRQRARDDRELEIGIPSMPTKVQRLATGTEPDYDPYPDAAVPAEESPVHLKILALCACDYIRFHLAEEGPALHA